MFSITGTEILALSASVVWPFKDVNRPLGEALETGDVRPRDLGWATWNAYDPIVKWAAAVQLKARELEGVELTPTAARQVVWPFKNLKRPIGELLAEQQIDLHDLAYAVAQAYKPEVREAAAVLGAELVRRKLALPDAMPAAPMTALPEPQVTSPVSETAPTPPVAPPEPAEPLQVIGGSDYLVQQTRRLQRWMIVMAIAVLYLWLGALLLSIGILIALALRFTQISWGWSVIGLALLLGAWFITPHMERRVEELDNYRQGQRGEQRVAAGLQRALKAPWVLFRNVVLPGQQADIDAVLVGPQGLYVLEIKALTGYYRNFGERWQRRYTLFWRDLSRNPSRQARRNAQQLHDYLQACGVEIWVEPRVVWASRSKLWLKQPAVPVWQITQSRFIGADLMKGKPLDEATRQQIVGLLKASIVAQRAKAQP